MERIHGPIFESSAPILVTCSRDSCILWAVLVNCSRDSCIPRAVSVTYTRDSDIPYVVSMSYISRCLFLLPVLSLLSVPTTSYCKHNQIKLERAGPGAASPGTPLLLYEFEAVLQNTVDRMSGYMHYTVPPRGRMPRGRDFHPSCHTRKAHIRICTDCRDAL